MAGLAGEMVCSGKVRRDVSRPLMDELTSGLGLTTHSQAAI